MERDVTRILQVLALKSVISEAVSTPVFMKFCHVCQQNPFFFFGNPSPLPYLLLATEVLLQLLCWCDQMPSSTSSEHVCKSQNHMICLKKVMNTFYMPKIPCSFYFLYFFRPLGMDGVFEDELPGLIFSCGEFNDSRSSVKSKASFIW